MENKRQEVLSIITTLIFCVMIFGLSIINAIKPTKSFSENENRYLAQMPKFSFESLLKGEFTIKYEEFVVDQFFGRDKWIALKTMTERAMLKQDINGVFFGRDGYLIEKHDESDIDEEQAEKNQKRLKIFVEKYSNMIGKENIKVMLVPTASEVLSNKLPPYAPGYNQNELIEKVKSEINKINDGFIDIRETLNSHKNEYIYYKTDHHWTSLGAYYAYKKWAEESDFIPYAEKDFAIEKVSDKFYGTIYSKVNINIKPDDINIYNIKENKKYSLIYNMGEKTTDTLYEMERLKEKDKYSVFMGGNNAVVEVETEMKNGRRLLVIKDSFAHSFVPFAVNHFEKTFMIDFRYFNGGVEDYINSNEITDILVLYNTINFVKDKNTGNFVK